MLKILSAPNPVLSQKAESVKKIDKSILKLIAEMSQTLLSARDPVGVGLAAPQVGKSLQIFIAKPTFKSPIQVFINPRIATSNFARGDTTGRAPDSAHLSIDEGALAGGKVVAGPRANAKDKGSTKLEGCLSLPNIWGQVKREPEITLSYLDEKGKHQSRKFNGFLATIIQHEMDHLNGILFSKRVLEQKGILYKSRKNKKGEDVFEEIEI